MPPIQLPAHWETKQLIVEDSKLEENLELQRACDACAYINEWTGLSEQPILSTLKNGDLPPNGTLEFFRLQSIRLAETHQMIGYLELYHGYPSIEVFWIGMFGIDPQFQGNGYGQELVNKLCELVHDTQGYSKIRLGVALNNWPAIRFWVKAGFDRIVKLNGDKNYSSVTFAFLVLEKTV
jgi:ribosomal protein S18 acetylase RimI-like enzyme